MSITARAKGWALHLGCGFLGPKYDWKSFLLCWAQTQCPSHSRSFFDGQVIPQHHFYPAGFAVEIALGITQTAMSVPEHFELERTSRWLFLASPWLMAAVAIFFAVMPFLPDDGRPRNEAFITGLSFFGIMMFGVGAWYSWRIVRALPEAAVSIDKEGLWKSIRDRNQTLVPWTKIVRLRERPMLQRLEALDMSGQVVARLEYQLHDFERLRAIVLQRASLLTQAMPSSGVFQKPMRHHIFSIGTMLVFTCLGWYVGQTQPLVGYIGMSLVVGMIGWEYLTTPFRLHISRDVLEIHSPGRRQRIPRPHVAAVEIQDELVNHAKHPSVALRLVGSSKLIKLKALGVQAVELHQALQAWRRGDA